MEITGTIKNAVWHYTGSIYGPVYGDVHKRFDDGQPIWTSTVMEDLGNGLYRTRNSIYKVEFSNEEGRPHDLPSRESGVKVNDQETN